MKADQWLYICAAHQNTEECCAIDYILHTRVDWVLWGVGADFQSGLHHRFAQFDADFPIEVSLGFRLLGHPS